MPESARRPLRVVPLDGDKLGHLAGALGALAVAIAQMFLRDASLQATIVRSGWTYVGVYAAVFVLVRMFLRASLFQMIQDKRERRELRRRQMKERQEAAKAAGQNMLGAVTEVGSPDAGTPPPSESGLPPL